MSGLKFLLGGSLSLVLVVGGVGLVSGCGSGNSGRNETIKASPEQEKAAQDIGQNYKDRFASKGKKR